MKIIGQKNVYYIDIGKCLYRGYIETRISLETESDIFYKYASMDILSINILLDNGTTIKPEVERFLLQDFLKNENHANVHANLYASEKEMSDILKLSGVRAGDCTIKIEYRPSEFNTSIVFYTPVYQDDKHREITAMNRLGYAYEIFPSIWAEDLRTGYPWELVYILPNSEEFKVVSPGVLKSFNEEERVNISMYYVEESIPDFINFAVGTFERIEIHNGDDKKVVLLPSNLEEYSDSLNDVVEDLSNILKYTEHFLQRSFPVSTLSIIFSMVDCEPTLGIGTAICNISLLTPAKDIEPMFEIKRTLSSIVASQVFYFYVHYSEITDFWIFCGMKGYLEDYCVRFLLGNNDFLFTLKEDKDFVLANDVYELPLCDSRRDFTSYHSDFFKKKSKLVFHTLESNLSKAFLEKICNFTLKKSSSEIGLNFTHDFIALIKDVTGKDMKAFFDTYVFKAGLVNISFRFTVDKKKNRVDFQVEQSPTSRLPDCNKTISGLVTVKSYEVEGSYDHSFNFNQDNHFYYHTRTKKKKKPEEEEEEIMPLLWIRIDPKREHLLGGVVEQPDYMYIEQLLDKNVVGQIEAIDYLSKRPSVQICEAFERILENSQMFYKIRIRILYVMAKINIDSYVGFQRVIQFFIKKFCVQSSTVIKPNDFNYINYFLQKHSIKALSHTDPFIKKNYNGRNVVSASIVCAFMINILRFNDNSMNNFSDTWYIASVIESLVRPILAMKFTDGENINFESKTECKQVFYNKDEVKKTEEFFEDSSEEDRDEDFNFLVEEDSSTSTIPERHEETEAPNYVEVAIGEIERYRLLDMVFPSHNNIVTEATLYFLGRLAINGCIGIKKDVLISLSKFPNAFAVRKASLTLLVVLFPDKDTIDFVLGLMKSESFRIKIAIVEILEETLSNEIISRDIFSQDLMKEIDQFLLIFPYDFYLRDKIQNIKMFVEGKDMSLEDFYEKLLAFYEEKHDKDFYFKKTMTRCVPRSADTIKIRLLNFIEMKREEMKKTYILKIPRDYKDVQEINSHGPSRKKMVKIEDRLNSDDTSKVVEDIPIPEDAKKVVEVKSNPKDTNKVVEIGSVSKDTNKVVEIGSVSEDTNKVVEEDQPSEKGKSIEEVNIKEMLEGDHYTEELLSSCAEKKKTDSPFITSKNQNTPVVPKPDISPNTPVVPKPDILSNTPVVPKLTSTFPTIPKHTISTIHQSSIPSSTISSIPPIRTADLIKPNNAVGFPINKLAMEERTPPIDTQRLLSSSTFSTQIPIEESVKRSKLLSDEENGLINKVNEKKEYLEGVLKEMKEAVEHREEMNVVEINDTAVNYKEVGEGIFRVNKDTHFDLETLLLGDDEPKDKTLENILEEDYPIGNQPVVDIDSFLDGNFDVMPPVNIIRETVENNYRMNSVKTSTFSLRLKIGWSFRIKAVDPRTLISPPKKRGRKSKSDYSKSDY
ncbi:Transcription initiation factor TFIID subunit 2, partial [Nosema granulosis]